MEKSVNTIYEKSLDAMQERLDQSSRELSNKFQKETDNYQSEYLLVLEDLTAELNKELQDKKLILQEIKTEIAEFKAKSDAAVEQAKRQLEMEDNIKFYQINIEPEDQKEIEALMSIENQLRNKRSLYMLIWTNYYSKAVNELANRVLGAGVVTGIYKITNIQTQQVYIGQSKDIRTRWRDHVKAGGLNIDCPSTNKFYKNMQKYGVENFTFELQEKCSANDLNDREKFWIDFFSANSFGLNSTSGNS